MGPIEGLQPTTKVLLVDDDDDLRLSTARVLTGHGYFCVEAANGAAALGVLDVQHDVAVVLCDITMPGQSGIDLLAELTADFPDVAVVMATGLDDPRMAGAAFDRGAFGYVIKPWDTNELLISLDSALRRRDHESSQRRHVRALERAAAAARAAGGLLDELHRTYRGLGSDLTPREREILGLIAAGSTNKQIARRLYLSVNTVRNHVRNILAKLDAHSKLEAVSTAVREGIVAYPND
ncbi:MAG TPA: response regulator transcription factor [Acidimicrobiales bacterium]|nr:response regulator transcription factor [Acidimicrobiales bacterium]